MLDTLLSSPSFAMLYIAVYNKHKYMFDNK